MAYLWLSNTKEKIQGEKGENKKKLIKDLVEFRKF